MNYSEAYRNERIAFEKYKKQGRLLDAMLENGGSQKSTSTQVKIGMGDGGIECSINQHTLAETIPSLGRSFYPDVAEAFKLRLLYAKFYNPNPKFIPNFTNPKDRAISNRMMKTDYSVDLALDSDGFPANLNPTERIIANAYLNRFLSNDQKALYQHMMDSALDLFELFISYRHFAERAHWTGMSDDFYKFVREARETGWFRMAPPTKEEMQCCGEWKGYSSVIKAEHALSLVEDSVRGLHLLMDDMTPLTSNISNIRPIFALVDKMIFFVAEHRKTSKQNLVCLDMADNKFRFMAEIEFLPDKIIGTDQYVCLLNGTNLCMVKRDDRSAEKIVSNINKKTLLTANGASNPYLVYANTEVFPPISEATAGDNSHSDNKNLFAVDLTNGTTKAIPFHLNTDCHKLFHVFGTTLYCCNGNDASDKNEAESTKHIGYKFDLTLDFPQPVAFEF